MDFKASIDDGDEESKTAPTGRFQPINLINFALFQLTWFGSVMGAAKGSILVGIIGIGLMFAFSTYRGTLRLDGAFVAVLIPLGWIVDSLWASSGILQYVYVVTPQFAQAFAPLWILLLWIGVGLSLNHGMSLFVARPLLGALLAGGAAPMSYLGGARLGAVEIPDPYALGWVALVWFGVFFAVFRFAARRQSVTSKDAPN